MFTAYLQTCPATQSNHDMTWNINPLPTYNGNETYSGHCGRCNDSFLKRNIA